MISLVKLLFSRLIMYLRLSYALGGVPYSIRFYLKESAASGDDSYTPLGTVHTFSTSFKSDGAVHCKICKDLADQDVRSTGQIPIKHALHDIARDTEHKSLETTNPDDVEGYLKDHLHWKVFMVSKGIPTKQLSP